MHHLDVHVERVLPLEGGVTLVTLECPLTCGNICKSHFQLSIVEPVNTQSSRTAREEPIWQGRLCRQQHTKRGISLHQTMVFRKVCSCYFGQKLSFCESVAAIPEDTVKLTALSHVSSKRQSEKHGFFINPSVKSTKSADRQSSDSVSCSQSAAWCFPSRLCSPLHTTASIVGEWLFPLYGDHSISTVELQVCVCVCMWLVWANGYKLVLALILPRTMMVSLINRTPVKVHNVSYSLDNN